MSSAWSRSADCVPLPANNNQLLGSKETPLEIFKAVAVVREYFRQSRDVNTAFSCLETLVQVGKSFRDQFYFAQEGHVLETIFLVLEILRNNQKAISASLRRLVLEYLETVEADDSSDNFILNLHWAFLFHSIRAELGLSSSDNQEWDALGGLIFDFSSILLSNCKHDVLLPYYAVTHPIDMGMYSVSREVTV